MFNIHEQILEGQSKRKNNGRNQHNSISKHIGRHNLTSETLPSPSSADSV